MNDAERGIVLENLMDEGANAAGDVVATILVMPFLAFPLSHRPMLDMREQDKAGRKSSGGGSGHH
jgi:hypothetical protein